MISINSIQKKQFISIFQMLKNVSNMIQMNMNEDKLHIQGMDNSHVSLYDIQLYSEYLDFRYYFYNLNILYYKNVPFTNKNIIFILLLNVNI